MFVQDINNHDIIYSEHFIHVDDLVIFGITWANTTDTIVSFVQFSVNSRDCAAGPAGGRNDQDGNVRVNQIGQFFRIEAHHISLFVHRSQMIRSFGYLINPKDWPWMRQLELL